MPDTTKGLSIIQCPACGVERWSGTGPCSECGAPAPEADEPEEGEPVEVGPNERAARAAVGALRANGTLDDAAVDEALTVAFVELARMLDIGGGIPCKECGTPGPPVKADLWREYRALIEAMRLIASGGADDDTKEYIGSITLHLPQGSRAAMGDPKDA